jgi:hypothetical protein
MVLLAIGCVATAQGAERIRYEQIADRIGALGGDRGATVFTIDGMKHAGVRFHLSPDQVSLYRKDGSIEGIRFDQIARVEIGHRRRHFFEFTVMSAVGVAALPVLVCDGDFVCAALAATVISPTAAAVAVGSAPVTLAMDGVALLIPPKVYEIVH